MCAAMALAALWLLLRARRAIALTTEAEGRFEGVFTGSGLALVIVDQRGRILHANPAAASLLAPDGTALVGAGIEAFIPHRYRRDHAGLRASFWTHPTARAMSVGRAVRALRSDGHELPVEITLSPVSLGQERAVLATITDLTGRARAEQELRQRTEELQRSNAALERFAWSASHDLQEPLRMIASYSQLLGRRYADAMDDDGRQMVGFAIDGARRMQRLINDLLAYARASQGDRPHVVTDTRAQWDAAIGLLASEIATAGADVALETDLPAVVAHPVEVQQVFQNLVSNALKYRSDARPVVRAGCVGVVDDGFLRFYVRDNGTGIEPHHRDKIFEAFERVGTAVSGTGIGLALCKTVVRSHGGDLGVESAAGGGANFWFTLPKANDT